MKSIFCFLILLLSHITFCSGDNAILEAFINLANKLSEENSLQNRQEQEPNLIYRQKEFNFPLESMIFSENLPNSAQQVTNVLEEPQPKVRTENGILIGESNTDSFAFYSIAYAKPPVGPRRFLSPEPADNHDDLDVSVPDYRSCWQTLPCEPNCEPKDGLLTEDCLVINIDVPKTVNLSDPDNPPDDKLPVLFWIHGGFFLFGSGTSFKTTANKFSRDAQVIVVQVNYRLGPFGFLSFQDGDTFIKGNQGLKDQQLALKWVQNNIKKFGGDKDRVTLFGNSAGAQSIKFHLLSSESDPYFRRAIIQSSPTVFPYQTPKQFNNTITRHLLKALNCDENPSCLRTLQPQAFTTVRGSMLINSLVEGDLFGAIEPFRPVVDGEEFTAQPLTLFKNGKWQTDKELIIGTTKEEMSYIEAVFKNIGLILPSRLFELLNTAVLGEENGQIMIDHYGQRAGIDYSDEFSEEITDFFFICPNRALARFAAKTSTAPNKKVYLYNLAYPLSLDTCGVINNLTTVCGFAYHASEPILLFKSDHAYGINLTEEDRFVADMMTSYWGKFAYSGDPSFEDTTTSPAFTSWPIYMETPQDPWKNIVLDYDQSTVDQDFKASICDMWDATNFYFEEESSSTTITPTSAADKSTSSESSSTTITPTSLAEKSTSSITELETTIGLIEESTTTDSASHLKTNNLVLLFFVTITLFFSRLYCQ